MINEKWNCRQIDNFHLSSFIYQSVAWKKKKKKERVAPKFARFALAYVSVCVSVRLSLFRLISSAYGFISSITCGTKTCFDKTTSLVWFCLHQFLFLEIQSVQHVILQMGGPRHTTTPHNHITHIHHAAYRRNIRSLHNVAISFVHCLRVHGTVLGLFV